jgi:hypothetical protein
LHTASLQSQHQATFVANRLHDLLNDADIGPESEQACREAVKDLHLVFQSESSMGETVPEKASGLMWTWPILLSSVFTNLLMKRIPEALIILCHTPFFFIEGAMYGSYAMPERCLFPRLHDSLARIGYTGSIGRTRCSRTLFESLEHDTRIGLRFLWLCCISQLNNAYLNLKPSIACNSVEMQTQTCETVHLPYSGYVVFCIRARIRFALSALVRVEN